ncbi:MAG TPA: TadE family protein [Nocardioidaceae bacterium]|nr:TadE family protein [Nocardioidaceae bacterium]
MTRRGARGERGSLAIEMAMIVPSILLIFGLIFVYGMAASVNGNLESATRDAARSATLARSYDEARERARVVVREGIRGLPKTCRDSVAVDVSPTFEPGEPVTVTVTCTYSISEIGLPGAPGSLSPESSFTSMLDPYRGVD